MFLNDKQIHRIGPFVIEPFIPARVQPASYDLTLFNEILVPTPSMMPMTGMDLRTDSPADYMHIKFIRPSGYIIESGKCVLGCTEEIIKCPDDMVISVEGKSSLARMFLVPHVASGWLDPGFKGQITLEIVNLGPWPIKLWPGMPIAQINFSKMASKAKRPYGSSGLGSHYHNQRGPTASTGKRNINK